MAICKACKEELPDDACFCGFCGFRVGPPSVPAPPDRAVIAPDAALVDEPDLGTASTLRASRPEELTLAKTTVRQRSDARACERHPLRVHVDYTSAHNFYTGSSENISRGGIFVATNTPAAVGELLNVSLTVPGLDLPCTVACEVRWVRGPSEEPGSEPGMGLRFLKIDAQTEAAIDTFMSHREPILHGR